MRKDWKKGEAGLREGIEAESCFSQIMKKHIVSFSSIFSVLAAHLIAPPSTVEEKKHILFLVLKKCNNKK